MVVLVPVLQLLDVLDWRQDILHYVLLRVFIILSILPTLRQQPLFSLYRHYQEVKILGLHFGEVVITTLHVLIQHLLELVEIFLF